MAYPPNPLQQPQNPYAAARLAAHRKALGTLRIYHSCDPPNIPLLHHYKAGNYTPASNIVLDPDYPTQTTLIPKRYGNTQTVLRCARGVGAGCLTCILTEYEATDLSLEVARAHGIRGAYVRPSPRAKTVEARIRDGVARGRVMHRDAATAEEQGDRALRAPAFHPKAGGCRKVLRWLGKVPGEAEAGSSVPVFGGRSVETVVAVGGGSLYVVPGLEGEDRLEVGAEWSTPLQWRGPNLHGRPVSGAVPQDPATAAAPLRGQGFGGQGGLDGHAGNGHSGIKVEPMHDLAASLIYMDHAASPMRVTARHQHLSDGREAGFGNLHAQSWSPEIKIESGCKPQGFPGFGPDERLMATAAAPPYGLGIDVDAVDVNTTHPNVGYHLGPWDEAPAAPVIHHPSFTATTTMQSPYLQYPGRVGQLGDYIDWQSYRANVGTPGTEPVYSPFSNRQSVPDSDKALAMAVTRVEKRMLEDAGVAAQARRKRAKYDNRNGDAYFWN